MRPKRLFSPAGQTLRAAPYPLHQTTGNVAISAIRYLQRPKACVMKGLAPLKSGQSEKASTAAMNDNSHPRFSTRPRADAAGWGALFALCMGFERPPRTHQAWGEENPMKGCFTPRSRGRTVVLGLTTKQFLGRAGMVGAGRIRNQRARSEFVDGWRARRLAFPEHGRAFQQKNFTANPRNKLPWLA